MNLSDTRPKYPRDNEPSPIPMQAPSMPEMPCAMIHTRYGWQLAPPGDQIVTGSLRRWGVYSDIEVKMLAHLLRSCESKSAIIAGGNIGGIGIPLAHRLIDSGVRLGDVDILMYEPQPMLAKLLDANISLAGVRGSVSSKWAALGSQETWIEIPIIDFSCPYNMGRFGKEDWEKEHPKGATTTTPMVNFQQELEWFEPSLILLDVEGMEIELLQAGRKYIEERAPLLWVEDDRPEHHPELLQLLDSLGYVPYWAITPLTPEGCAPGDSPWPYQASFNLMCVPFGKKAPIEGLRVAGAGDPVGRVPVDWIVTGFRG